MKRLLAYRSPRLTQEDYLWAAQQRFLEYKASFGLDYLPSSPPEDGTYVDPAIVMDFGFWIWDYCLKAGVPYTKLPPREAELLYKLALMFFGVLASKGEVDESINPLEFFAALGESLEGDGEEGEA